MFRINRKKTIILLLFICSLIYAQEINVITYNIRFNNPADGIHAWPNRKEMVAELLKFHDAEIIGLQEALKDQISDIIEYLPKMRSIGVGRDDGHKAGEYCPILFDTTKYNLVNSGWFWLSENPNKPGLGWGANFNRICTWVELISKNGNQLLVLNTHLDHESQLARINSVKLIKKKIDELNTRNLPLILMGDFNALPDNEAIQFVQQFLRDSKKVSIEKPYGPTGTFNGFNFNSPLTDRIDYIFVNDKIKVLKYAVLSDSKDNRYPSDHLPVFVRIKY